jgi:hypothetical protein
MDRCDINVVGDYRPSRVDNSSAPNCEDGSAYQEEPRVCEGKGPAWAGNADEAETRMITELQGSSNDRHAMPIVEQSLDQLRQYPLHATDSANVVRYERDLEWSRARAAAGRGLLGGECSIECLPNR